MKAEEPTGWTIGQLAQVSGAASLIVKLFRPDKDTNSASKKQSLFFYLVVNSFFKERLYNLVHTLHQSSWIHNG